MKNKKNFLITGLVCLSLLFSAGFAVASNSTNNSGELKDVKKEELVQTQHDIDKLYQLGFKLSKPKVDAIITEEKAVAIASEYTPIFAAEAKSIHAEYQLFTDPNFNLFSEESKEKNPQLKKDGFLNETPVYIVTFKGINGVGLASKKGQEQPRYSENNIVIDASSGEVLLSFTYK